MANLYSTATQAQLPELTATLAPAINAAWPSRSCRIEILRVHSGPAGPTQEMLYVSLPGATIERKC